MSDTGNISKPQSRRRFRKVLKVLIKYGFEDIVSHLPLRKWLSGNGRLIPKRNGKSIFSYSTYHRMRMVVEELGTTFIKFAQLAANRPDILPKELLDELTSFQDHAPLVPAETIKEILQQEYRRPLKELFEYINYKPVASASMAQVHYARTVGGREVVLKIQRPGIEENVMADINIMMWLATIIEKRFPQYVAYQPVELVKMFEKSITKELHFKLEQSNTRRFQRFFKGNEDIYVPDIFPEYSTDRVLCMEYIDGIKITDTEAYETLGLDSKEIVYRGIDLYFQQVFVHGFFHADPHPGNIFVLKDGRICFIDFGMMGTVSEPDKILLAELLLALANRDVMALKKILLEEFTTKKELVNQKELEYYLLDFFDLYSHLDIGEIDVNEAVSGLNTLFFDFGIKVPPNLLLLLKAMVIIEGIGLKIHPGYNIIENITPFARMLLEVKLSPQKLSRKVTRNVLQATRMIEKFPSDVEAIIDKIKTGRLHIEFEHKGLKPFFEKMEIVNNRLSFSLVLAAFILGSSIMVVANVPPFIYNIPLLGVLGFGISGLLAMKLFFSILKHGNF